MGALDARAIDAGGLKSAAFPKVKHEFRVHVAEDAFDRATGRGDSHLDREIGGILVGEVCRDESGPYVRIDTTIDALHAEEQGTELTFTHATWEHVHKEMDTRHQGKRIVGWYHTHPGFGVFLSDRDTFIHQSFFNLPYQIALVYDPKSREHGAFVWRDNEPKRARRYWVGEREHVWDGAPPPRAPSMAAEAPMPEGPAKPAPAIGEPPDRFGLTLGGLALLLIGGLVGWLVARWGAGDDAQQLQRQAEKERIAGGEDALLVGRLRDSVAGGVLVATIDEATKRIDRALQTPGTPPAALEELQAARGQLHALKRIHADALRVLELLAREAVGLEQDRMAIALHRALLGQLCAEVAAMTPDKATARRLLLNAKEIDPGNREAYEKRLRELEK